MQKHLWHEALDLQMDAHKYYLTPIGRMVTIDFFSVMLAGRFPEISTDPEVERLASTGHHFIDSFIETLWRGDTVAIEPDIHPLIFKAAEDYDGPISIPMQEMLTPIGFMYIPDGIIGEDIDGKTNVCHAISWQQSRILHGVIEMYFFTDTRDDRDEWVKYYKEGNGPLGPMPPLQLMHIFPLNLIKAPLAEDFNIPGAYMTLFMLKYWISMQWLARQTKGTVKKEKVRPPRPAMRRAQKWNPERDSYISLITLRRKAAKRTVPEKEINWTHRWVVGGHWRKQPYPSSNTYKYIYIAEYVKGPDHLPLIVRERRVFDFAR